MKRTVISIVCLVFLLAACSLPAPASTPTAMLVPSATQQNTVQPTEFISPTATLQPTKPNTPTLTPTPQPVRFAVIGDYGSGDSAEADVAKLILGWHPDFIITTGDNNYPDGAADTIDKNVGKYFHAFIFPYTGAYGSGPDGNRFFPSLGNHDWHAPGAQPYLDYFSLPGNERYYDFVWGPVHFFALDSDEHEPDGFRANSAQAAWLKQGLAASTSPWNIVYFHHAAYSSGSIHGSSRWMQWPFTEWGADAVLAGHEHLYERFFVDGIPYFSNGSGGGGLYDFETPLPESKFRYNADYGAMLVTASGTELTFEFYSRVGHLIDQYKVSKP